MMSVSLLWALWSACPLETPPPPPPSPAPPPAGAPTAVQDEPAEPELPDWTGSITAGAKYTGGNTETSSVNVQFDAERRDEMDRWTFKAWWNYGEQKIDGDTEITVRNEGGFVKYDYFATEKLYYLGIAGAEADSLAGLDLRWYAGAGLGYQFLESEETSLLAEAALTYFVEEFDDGTDQESVALRLAYSVSHQLTETTRFEQDLVMFPSLEDIEDFYGKLDTRVQTNLTDSMFAQLQNIIDYDNTPSSGKERLDNQVLLTLGWSF